jgi:CRP/FNR family transcriptional regulator
MNSTDSLGQIALFRGLSERALAKLEAASTFRRIEESETYFRGTDNPRHVSIVVSGQLKLYRVNRAGKEQVFLYAHPGEALGLFALTEAARPWGADCVARTATEVIEIDVNLLRDMLSQEPQFCMAVLAEQNRRLMHLSNLVDQLSLKDAHNRLALWLEEWISRHHRDAGERDLQLVLPFTQSEIAAQIGTVREVVSRGFSRMEKEGVLKASGKRVTLLSRAKLREMAGQ